MKRCAILAALAGAGCEVLERPPAPLAPVAVPADLGQRAFAHVAAVVGVGQRHPGTPGWAAQIEYITGRLQACGLEPRVDRWTDAREGIAFANVVAELRGRGSDRIVLACHHDTKNCTGHADPAHNFPFVGANDGGSGVGLLLALAETLAAAEPREATIQFAFFDGEESLEPHWNEARALFGSRRFVTVERAAGTGRHWREPIRAMLLLDMVGAKDLQLDDDSNSHPGMKAVLRAAAAACDARERFFQRRNTVSDDHLPFVVAGIPAAVLIDLADNPQWHTANDTLEHISPVSLHTVGSVVLTALPELERRFLPARTPR